MQQQQQQTRFTVHIAGKLERTGTRSIEETKLSPLSLVSALSFSIYYK